MEIIKSRLEEICSKEKGSLISGPFGSNISSKYFVSSGLPVIRGNNLSTNLEKFVDDGFVYITEEKAKELNCYAIKNDIIFTAAGTLGQVGIIPENSKYSTYVISNKQVRARIDTSKVNELYAYYWFNSPWIKKYLTRNNKGSTVPLLTLMEIKNIPIYYPKSIDEQKRIANFIDLIYKLIKNNNMIIDSLEKMAELIYHQHLYEFCNCKNRELVFDSKSKMRIPEGWSTKKISEILPVLTGKEDANFSTIDGKFPFFTCSKDVLKCDKPSFSGHSVLIAGNGDFNVKHYSGEFNAYQRTYVLKCTKEFYGSIYLLVKDMINKFKKGSNGSIVKFIKKSDIENLVLLIPDDNNKIHNNISELILKAEIIRGENEKLINSLNFLIPLLMNGKIKIGD